MHLFYIYKFNNYSLLFALISSPSFFPPFRVHNLSLIIFADWHDEILLQREKYVDDNTHSTWYPIVGGSNVPAINNLLGHFQAQLGLQTFDGQFQFGGSNVRTVPVLLFQPSILHTTSHHITSHHIILDRSCPYTSTLI